MHIALLVYLIRLQYEIPNNAFWYAETCGIGFLVHANEHNLVSLPHLLT